MTSKLVTIEVPPSSQATLQVPIKPLILGRFLIRARPTDESEDYLTAEMEILQEGLEIAKSSQMLIDLSTRPYFMESLKIPGFPDDRKSAMNSKNSQQKITLTRGLVGPIVVHFPYNISGLHFLLQLFVYIINTVLPQFTFLVPGIFRELEV